jgi:hypothetical protein
VRWKTLHYKQNCCRDCTELWIQKGVARINVPKSIDCQTQKCILQITPNHGQKRDEEWLPFSTTAVPEARVDLLLLALPHRTERVHSYHANRVRRVTLEVLQVGKITCQALPQWGRHSLALCMQMQVQSKHVSVGQLGLVVQSSTAVLYRNFECCPHRHHNLK